MRKFNINKEAIGNFVKEGCKFALYGLAAILPYVSTKDMTDMMRYSGDVKYSDAVGAIMDSRMFSSDKNTAMAMLKKDETADYYRTVIRVVNSNMYSGDKLNAIMNICDRMEES